MKKKVVAFATVAVLSSTFATSAFANTYTVQKGDTLSQIAKKHSTTVSNLKTLNGLNSDLIFINQSLKVTSDGVVTTPQVKQPAISAPTSTVSTYTVVKGDTLSKIAKQHHISLSDLMSWNNLTSHLIYPGNTLKVSTSSNTQVQAPANSENQNKPVVTPSTPAPITTSTTYVVQKGDTLSHISKKFDTTVNQLKEANNLKSDLIFVAQTLKIGVSTSPITTQPSNEVIEKAPAPAPAITTPVSQDIVSIAKSLIGIPYVWAGSSTTGFDCSGFIYYAFKAVGQNISRLSTDGYYSRSYYVDNPQVGDLVFFENTYRKGISHMGIYLGNNEFIHASTSKGVTISNLNQSYYKERFDGFKRFY